MQGKARRALASFSERKATEGSSDDGNVMVDTNPKIFEPNFWIHIQGNLKWCSRRPWINILFNLEVLHDGIPMLQVNGTPRPSLLDLQVQSD